jgi:hypothetical protein
MGKSRKLKSQARKKIRQAGKRAAQHAGSGVGDAERPRPVKLGEQPPQEQVAMGLIEPAGVSNEEVRRYRSLSWPPDLLHYRYKTLSQGQHDACLRFADLFFMAGMMPRMSLSDMPKGNGQGMSDRSAQALVEWGRAYRAVQGNSGRRLAVDVICSGYAPTELLRPPKEGEVMQFTRFEREKVYRNRDAVVGRFIEACCDLQRYFKFLY